MKRLIKSIILLVLVLMAVGLGYWLLMASRWDWLAKYYPLLISGLWLTLVLWVLSCIFGMILAIPIGLVQVTGPSWLAALARGFCTVIRGTPLLLQLWLIYYGVGSLFPQIAQVYPEFRQDFMWLIRLDAFWYALLAFTLSFAGYEGEIMRGAFLGVPRGELEAARAYGMSPWKVLVRVWLPRAIRLVLPTLAGEVILQLKATPLAMTVTVMDLTGVVRSRITPDTLIVYEPLMLLAFIYICITFITVWLFGRIEASVPGRR
jgi:polar amino acid transport system permease protein